MDVLKFKGIMVSKGYTQKTLCKAINMSEQTMIRKLKTNGFDMNEAAKIAKVLEMDNPSDIFFPKM